jgi:hypothetical protein
LFSLKKTVSSVDVASAAHLKGSRYVWLADSVRAIDEHLAYRAMEHPIAIEEELGADQTQQCRLTDIMGCVPEAARLPQRHPQHGPLDEIDLHAPCDFLSVNGRHVALLEGLSPKDDVAS